MFGADLGAVLDQGTGVVAHHTHVDAAGQRAHTTGQAAVEGKGPQVIERIDVDRLVGLGRPRLVDARIGADAGRRVRIHHLHAHRTGHADETSGAGDRERKQLFLGFGLHDHALHTGAREVAVGFDSACGHAVHVGTARQGIDRGVVADRSLGALVHRDHRHRGAHATGTTGHRARDGEVFGHVGGPHQHIAAGIDLGPRGQAGRIVAYPGLGVGLEHHDREGCADPHETARRRKGEGLHILVVVGSDRHAVGGIHVRAVVDEGLGRRRGHRHIGIRGHAHRTHTDRAHETHLVVVVGSRNQHILAGMRTGVVLVDARTAGDVGTGLACVDADHAAHGHPHRATRHRDAQGFDAVLVGGRHGQAAHAARGHLALAVLEDVAARGIVARLFRGIAQIADQVRGRRQVDAVDRDHLQDHGVPLVIEHHIAVLIALVDHAHELAVFVHLDRTQIAVLGIDVAEELGRSKGPQAGRRAAGPQAQGRDFGIGADIGLGHLADGGHGRGRTHTHRPAHAHRTGDQVDLGVGSRIDDDVAVRVHLGHTRSERARVVADPGARGRVDHQHAGRSGHAHRAAHGTGSRSADQAFAGRGAHAHITRGRHLRAADVGVGGLVQQEHLRTHAYPRRAAHGHRTADADQAGARLGQQAHIVGLDVCAIADGRACGLVQHLHRCRARHAHRGAHAACRHHGQQAFTGRRLQVHIACGGHAGIATDQGFDRVVVDQGGVGRAHTCRAGAHAHAAGQQHKTRRARGADVHVTTGLHAGSARRPVVADGRACGGGHAVDAGRQGHGKTADPGIGRSREDVLVAPGLHTQVVTDLEFAVIGHVGTGGLVDHTKVDAGADAAGAAVLGTAGDGEDVGRIAGTQQRVLAAVRARVVAVDRDALAQPGLGGLVQHIDRDRAADAEGGTARETDDDGLDIFEGRCRHGQAARGLGGAVAIVVAFTGLHGMGAVVAARRDLGAVAYPGLDRILMDEDDGRQAEGRTATAHRDIARHAQQFRVAGRLHDDVAIGIDPRVVADGGIGVVHVHDDGHRTADARAAAAQRHVGRDRELFLVRVGFHDHAATGIHIGATADMGLAVQREHLHVDGRTDAGALQAGRQRAGDVQHILRGLGTHGHVLRRRGRVQATLVDLGVIRHCGLGVRDIHPHHEGTRHGRAALRHRAADGHAADVNIVVQQGQVQGQCPHRALGLHRDGTSRIGVAVAQTGLCVLGDDGHRDRGAHPGAAAAADGAGACGRQGLRAHVIACEHIDVA